MANFLDDVIFPTAISRGSSGGPDWYVEVTELASGAEERNTPHSAPIRRYDARWAVRSEEELYEITSLYHIAMGPLRGFRMLDWTDYKSCSPSNAPAAIDQALGTGDGSTVTFELNKVYSVGAHSHTRRISKPFGPVLVAIDGVAQGSGFTADTTAGTVTFDAAPVAGQLLTWGGEFHVPVRFDGALDLMELHGKYGDIPSIPLKELRL